MRALNYVFICVLTVGARRCRVCSCAPAICCRYDRAGARRPRNHGRLSRLAKRAGLHDSRTSLHVRPLLFHIIECSRACPSPSSRSGNLGRFAPVGTMGRMLMDGTLYPLRIVREGPYDAAYPASPWRRYEVEWLSEDTGEPTGDPHEFVSPWELVLEDTFEREPPRLSDEQAQKCMRAVETVEAMENAQPFIEEVDRNLYTAYLEIVAYPIHLRRVKERLRNSFYRQQAVRRDNMYIAADSTAPRLSSGTSGGLPTMQRAIIRRARTLFTLRKKCATASLLWRRRRRQVATARMTTPLTLMTSPRSKRQGEGGAREPPPRRCQGRQASALRGHLASAVFLKSPTSRRTTLKTGQRSDAAARRTRRRLRHLSGDRGEWRRSKRRRRPADRQAHPGQGPAGYTRDSASKQATFFCMFIFALECILLCYYVILFYYC